MYKINFDSIDFFWDTEKIFELVTHKTGVRAKNMNVSDDRLEIDYIITEDERDYVVTQLEGAMRSLYGMFVDITLSDGDSFYVSQPNTDLGIFISGFSVRCNRDGYGAMIPTEKRIGTVSTLAQEYLASKIISCWSEDNEIKEYEKINSEVLDEIVLSLRLAIIHLKRRSSANSFS